jgi:hypothetical protein
MTLANEISLGSEGVWKNIRLLADFSNCNVEPTSLAILKNKLFPATFAYLESALKVYPATLIKPRYPSCFMAKVP